MFHSFFKVKYLLFSSTSNEGIEWLKWSQFIRRHVSFLDRVHNLWYSVNSRAACCNGSWLLDIDLNFRLSLQFYFKNISMIIIKHVTHHLSLNDDIFSNCCDYWFQSQSLASFEQSIWFRLDILFQNDRDDFLLRFKNFLIEFPCYPLIWHKNVSWSCIVEFFIELFLNQSHSMCFTKCLAIVIDIVRGYKIDFVNFVSSFNEQCR